VGKGGSYTDKSTRKQNGKANVMLGEKIWCSKSTPRLERNGMGAGRRE